MPCTCKPFVGRGLVVAGLLCIALGVASLWRFWAWTEQHREMIGYVGVPQQRQSSSTPSSLAEAVVVIGSPSELLIGKEQSDAVVRLLTLAATASGLVPRDLFVLLNGPNPTRPLVTGDWLRGLQPLERQLAEQNLGQLQAAGFRVDVLPGLPTTDVPAEVEQVGKLQTKRTVHPSWQTLQHRKGQGHAKYYHWIRSTAAAELYERFWFVEWDVAFTGKWSTLFDRELRRGPADMVAAKTYRTSCLTDPQARALRPPCGTRGRRVPKAHLYLERVERRFVVEMGAILDEGNHAGFFELFVPYVCKEMLLVKRSAVAVEGVQVVHDDAGAAARRRGLVHGPRRRRSQQPCVIRSLEASVIGNGQLGGWGQWDRPLEIEDHLSYLLAGTTASRTATSRASSGTRAPPPRPPEGSSQQPEISDKVFHPVKRSSPLLRGFLSSMMADDGDDGDEEDDEEEEEEATLIVETL